MQAHSIAKAPLSRRFHNGAYWIIFLSFRTKPYITDKALGRFRILFQGANIKLIAGHGAHGLPAGLYGLAPAPVCRLLCGCGSHCADDNAGNHKGEKKSEVVHNAPPVLYLLRKRRFRRFRLKVSCQVTFCIIVSLTDTVNTVFGTNTTFFQLDLYFFLRYNKFR